MRKRDQHKLEDCQIQHILEALFLRTFIINRASLIFCLLFLVYIPAEVFLIIEKDVQVNFPMKVLYLEVRLIILAVSTMLYAISLALAPLGDLQNEYFFLPVTNRFICISAVLSLSSHCTSFNKLIKSSQLDTL